MKNIVITGDSLSYNRYGYYDTPSFNPYDCPVGMGSWSFRIRNELIMNASGFVYGDEIDISGSVSAGVGDNVDLSNSIFAQRCVTVAPVNNEIRMNIFSDTGRIALYLQKSPDRYCRFSVWVDGVKQASCVDTFGEIYEYHGYALFTLELECDLNKKNHEIVFADFDYGENEPVVTVAGASGEAVRVNLTGKGSRTAKFLLYHFEERIEKYHPDMLILIFGGNDALLYSSEEYRKYLYELFLRIKASSENCRLITLTIPYSGKLDREIRGKTYHSDAEWNSELSKYNDAMKDISKEFGAELIDTVELFEGISSSEWRFDNVHFNKKGNDILYNKVYELIFGK